MTLRTHKPVEALGCRVYLCAGHLSSMTEFRVAKNGRYSQDSDIDQHKTNSPMPPLLRAFQSDVVLLPSPAFMRLSAPPSPQGLSVAFHPASLPRVVTRTRRRVPLPLLSPELQTLVLAHLAGEPLISLSTDAFRRALPLALTCRAYYNAFKSAVRGVRILPIGFASAAQEPRLRSQERGPQNSSPSVAALRSGRRAALSGEPLAEHTRRSSSSMYFGRASRPSPKISDANIEAMVSSLPALVEIQLSTAVALTNAGVASIARCCPQIRTLQISGNHEISDLAVTSLRECKHLRSLDLSFCNQLTNSSAADFAAMPSLVSLSVSQWSISDEFLKTLFADGGGCAIEELSLNGCCDLSDTALLHASLGAGPRLRSLKLRRCRRISDAGLSILVEHCSVLESLDVSSNEMITAEGFGRLGAVSTLRSLVANSVVNISDDAVARVAEGGHLTSISLSWCPNLTDLSARALSPCRNLNCVNLSGCKKLTDEGVATLACLPALETVGLMYCGELTSASLRTLATAASSPLKEVDIRFVKNLDADMLEHLRANCDVVHDSVAQSVEGQGQRIWTCRREIRNVPMVSAEYF